MTQFLKALFAIFRFAVGTVAATGNNQATAAALPAASRIKVTAADGVKAVKFVTAIVGQEVEIMNTDAAGVLVVYPAVGDNFEGLADDVALTGGLAPLSSLRVCCFTAGEWTVMA